METPRLEMRYLNHIGHCKTRLAYMTTRYLTKSRFKMALECPTKLRYTGNPAYVNARSNDSFMEALADGGFQVGELAKVMHPAGVEVVAKGHAEALRHTQQLLEADTVTIFEAAICSGPLFVRIDVLIKNGKHLEIIEVKAKSYDAKDQFTNGKGAIKASYLPYLQDVAFQVFVLRAAYPEYSVSACLMLADKGARSTVDNLGQRFKIARDKTGHRVDIAPGTDSISIGAPLLTKVPVTALVDQIINATISYPGGERPFLDAVADFAHRYQHDDASAPFIGSHCRACEFKSSASDPGSGFHLCWKQATGWTEQDFDGGTVLDLWNHRGKDALIRNGTFALRQVMRDDLTINEHSERLSQGQRQWMQVSGEWPGGGAYFLDRDGLREATSTWTYPLHFIDFETSRTALPFHLGRRPYEQIAFQFSHHIMDADGTVSHAGQFLEATPGVFPNYAFVRELRRQLISDHGTILRWASHENSVLRDIWQQLEEDPAAPADKLALQAFILDITTEKTRVGSRTMIDLCKMAEHFYFHPMTKGSCSIKKVLPAVLHSSRLLRDRYAAPNYGSDRGVASLNFTNWSWWRARPDADAPHDPYSLLDPAFLDDAAAPSEADDEHAALADGGAALAAYGRLQYETIDERERQRLSAALLRYCELDTLAMVMVWEAWRGELG